MAVSFVSVKCPECGASLPIEEGRSSIFCSYCGTKVIVTNENEHIYRHIDEASIKKTETDRLIRLREIELEEKERELERAEKQQRTKRTIIIFVVWIAVSALFILLGQNNKTCSTIGYGLGVVGLWVALFWFLSNETRKTKEEETRNIQR